MAWHLKGAAGTFDEWLDKPDFDRELTAMEVRRRIEIHNSAFDDDF